MKKNKSVIFVIILLIIITIVFCLKSYATDVDNEIQDNNTTADPPIIDDNEDDNSTGEQNKEEEENPEEQQPPETQEPDSEKSEEEEPPTQTEPPQESNPTTPDDNNKPSTPSTPSTPNKPSTPTKPTDEKPKTPSKDTTNQEQTNNNEKPETPNTNNNTNGGNKNSVPVVAEVKSKNNNLQSLEIVGRNIEPVFEKNITEYYLIVELDVEELEVIAVAEDEKASVGIEGNTGLVEGENTIIVTVTAEDGSKKEYKIIITKTDNAETANADLKSLVVSDYDIFPSFSSKIYNYNLTINKDIAEIEILAEVENENATMEITGNENLKKGENIITIIVTAEDGITKRKYNINTYISTFNVEIQEENKTPAKIAIIILLVVIIGLALFIRIKKK